MQVNIIGKLNMINDEESTFEIITKTGNVKGKYNKKKISIEDLKAKFLVRGKRISVTGEMMREGEEYVIVINKIN